MMLGVGLLIACTSVATQTAAPLVHVDPPPLVMASSPMPYGFWGLNGFVHPVGLEDVKSRLGLSIFQVACSDPEYAVEHLLPYVKKARLKVTLRMTEDHEAYTSGGDFDLQAWKNQFLRWEGISIQSYIDDGTLAGHMLLDDIDTFDGYNPSAADLEEMARYSKELFPGLMTFVRKQASELPVPASGRYTWVDAAVNQYEALEGPIEPYVSNETQAATRLGVGIINGLNIADGGDGSSGQPGWRAGHWAMSATEILSYGRALLGMPGCGMFLNWEYDARERWSDGTIGAQYFQRTELQDALYELSQEATRYPQVVLLKP